ncbi:MAG: EamA family transporter [Rhodobacteraceae bacterium]|nr:EamA family transporter [Paracoccaceae bacterium]
MPTDQNPVRAAFWMIGAIVSFSSMAVAGRAIAPELDTFELMMYRSFIGLAIVLAVGGWVGTLGQISTRHFGLHLIRNIGHFTGQNLWFFAITLIPLAQVFALEFTGPLWATLLAVFILGERITGFRAATLIAGFVGILIVTRPWINPIGWGVIAGALAAVGFAISMVLTRLLARSISITTILFWLTAMQATFGVITAGFDGDIAWPSALIWPWVVLVALGGLLAHFCLTRALSLAPAAVVMPVDFARLPVIALIGVWLYNESLDPMVLIGAAIIFGANYLNIWREARSVPNK